MADEATTPDETAAVGDPPEGEIKRSLPAERQPADSETAEGDAIYGKGDLLSPGFLSLLATQFFTAVNDNIFRWLAIGIGKQFFHESQTSFVLMAGTAFFSLPYLFLTAPAGYLADRFRKRSVIVSCKSAEIVIMVLGLLAIAIGNVWLLFAAVALMGAQSALLSPSRGGSIPEILRHDKISTANGLFGLATITACVIGTAIGLIVSDMAGAKGQERLWIPAVALLSVAAIGFLCSLPIASISAANPQRPLPWNAVTQTYRDLATLFAHRPLLRVALGISFFFAIGVLANLNIEQLATEGDTSGKQTQAAPLLISLVIGVGAGSILAGVWSGGRVELGILPLGAAVVALSSILLSIVEGPLTGDAPVWTAQFWTFKYIFACLFLVLLGIGAGLFDVPLESYLQERSPRAIRGSILAASNFLVFTGIILASILYWLMRIEVTPGEGPLFSVRQVFLLSGLATIPVFFYVIFVIPHAAIRFVVWLLSRTLYRIRVYGVENIPPEGGVVLTPNHVSWLDGILIMLVSPRRVRMVVHAGNFRNSILLWMSKLFGAILISHRPKEMTRGIEAARQALQDGDMVCIFPEGGITRTGQVQAFRPGLMRILDGVDAPVLPVYLDELWGSIFSFEGGKFFWKAPRRWPYPVSIHFGKPLAAGQSMHVVRQAVLELGASAVEQRTEQMRMLPRSFVRQCKRNKFREKIYDSTGVKMTGGELLMRSLILRRLLRRNVLADDEQHVGLLLPPSAGGVIANMALALDKRISTNLNYTVSSDVMNQCIEMAGIKHVLTSRKFMERLNLEIDAELVYLDDFKDQVTLFDKAITWTHAYLTPAGVLERMLGLKDIKGDDILTVIFTSGSTGAPKGVELTHKNIASQIEAIDNVIQLTSDDTLLGVLPFFHSLGYTVTMWTVMAIEPRAVYHYNPLDAKAVSKLCGQHKCTVLLATPTFLRMYLRRAKPEEFESLDVVVAGAERLPSELCDAFEKKFGVRPVEGYGTTELSPLVSVNIPPSRSIDNFQTDLKEGTVGRPVPGVSAKVVNLDSGEELSSGQEGMLMVKGPNVMRGYLGRSDLTEEVLKDGWYVTGDIALIDEEGFIRITGRQSRFSKIGGEMVPHVKIEEALLAQLGEGEAGSQPAAVTSVDDEKKGERLVVLHTKIDKTPEQLRRGLSEAGLPNLFIPSEDSFVEVEDLPVLGSGKLDLKAVKQLAEEKFNTKGG